MTDEQVVAHVDGFEEPTFDEYPLRVVDRDLVFRQATAEDLDALLTFWIVAAENDARPTDDARSIEQVLARDPAAVIIAERDGRLVGSVIAGWDGWRAHLYRLAVHPDARGQGLGRRLVGLGERRLVALGARRIDAMVLDANDDGAAVWRAVGYTPQGEWTRWVKPIDPHGDPDAATVE